MFKRIIAIGLILGATLVAASENDGDNPTSSTKKKQYAPEKNTTSSSGSTLTSSVLEIPVADSVSKGFLLPNGAYKLDRSLILIK